MLLAVSYILGQINLPILQLVNFVRELQDAKISLERLGEIHDMPNEVSSRNAVQKINNNEEISINIKDLSYRYPGTYKSVLNNLSLHIPCKKITAIVGSSGSGKTTLMKILLGFYSNYNGNITINDQSMKSMNIRFWRDHCGVVMQEGYIFNDTIEGNVALGVDEPDYERIDLAISLANIKTLIDDLPQGLSTQIGTEGLGLSSGQKQRILIARAIYKNPKVLFFDEATSALDATNENTIMDNLYQYFEDKTVIIIAHRLSTVKNADQIVVLENGEIVEIGTHEELKQNKENYYRLVKDQLDLR